MLSVLLLLLPLMTSSSRIAIGKDDVACLRGFKSSVSDPFGELSTWNFSANTTAGFICSFSGVLCWNLQENRVISISLPSLSLSGPIPSALRLCSSVTSLDLSDNNLSGPIPASLCTWLPYLVFLNLSSNSLTGPIPPELSGCTYLNSLVLSSNRISGSVPPSLSLLQRLHTLELADNDLSGAIPVGLGRFGASSFLDNPSLCGYPVSDCREPVALTNIIVVDLVAGVFGFLLSLAISYAVWRCCIFSELPAPKKMITKEKVSSEKAAAKVIMNERVSSERAVEARRRSRSSSSRNGLLNSGLVRISLFREPVEEVMVADLMAATADFHPGNVVVAGCSGVRTSYKAVLWDGSILTVKRLHECPLSEQQFRTEMCTVRQLQHPNLVPLLGFCVAGEEDRLLIYKNMANGALSSLLENWDERLDWPTRLRIGIGTARGLAWLHHGFQVPFLHQNFTSSAVLLDEDYEPRITDFGLSRLLSRTTGSVSTTKDDVYEFGVVLLELATDHLVLAVENYIAGGGSSRNLADLVLRLSVAGRVAEAIDQSLRGRGHDDQIVEFLKVACRCVAARPEERPSMYRVYRSLKSIGGRHELREQYDEFPLLYC